MEAKVRPARASDKEPLMKFIRHVWGGHDYLPYVWDQWLRDPHGVMSVVEVDGVPVGMNKVTFLEDGSAWFEGVRVHPDFRGKGLASMLGENSMRLARERGVRAFRLTSGSTNRAAHRQIARIRFSETSRISVYRPPKGWRLRRNRRAVRAVLGGVARVIDLIQKSKEYRLGKGVFWHEYKAASLTPEVVARLVKEGAVWTFGDAVAVTREGGEGGGKWEEYCFLGGPVKDAVTLLDSVMGWRKGASVRWVFVPQGSPLIHALRSRGFERDYALVLFERSAANG